MDQVLPKYKIIFLDIDGVLNCRTTQARCGAYIGIDPKKLDYLAEIIEATDAKIVLSSSWKHAFGSETLAYIAKYLTDALASVGLTIMDLTPTCDMTSYRGREIQEWFVEHHGKDCIVQSFVILDDDSDLKPYKSRWLQTSYSNGLQEKHIAKVVSMLSEDCEPWFDDTAYWKEGYLGYAPHRQI